MTPPKPPIPKFAAKDKNSATHSPSHEGNKAHTSVEQYLHAVGRRKEAVATAKVFSSPGNVTINGQVLEQYFQTNLRDEVTAPFTVLGLNKSHHAVIRVTGGGIRGQAEASRLAIARALILENPEWKKTLRSYGYVTRDPRSKERKKYGLKRARRAPQWTKR